MPRLNSYSFICPFVHVSRCVLLASGAFLLSGCYPVASSPSGRGTVRLAVRDSPPTTHLNIFDGVVRRGRRHFAIPGDLVCARSPCDTKVPPGSTFVVSSPDFPWTTARMPTQGDAEMHVRPGSNLWQDLMPWTAGVGIIGSLGGLAGVVDGSERMHASTELAAGWTALGVGTALTIASFYLLSSTKTNVTFAPLSGIHF
jgi:hypothetical protein